MTPEQRKAENAILIFEIKNKDLLKKRFLAECFLPFSQIPETSSHEAIIKLEQVHLKLSRPTTQSNFMLVFFLLLKNIVLVF